MSDILQIKFGITDHQPDLTCDARAIFKSVGWTNSRLFLYDEVTQNPNILGVGYVGYVPAVAAAIAEMREPSLAGVDYTQETRRLLDEPYLAIRGLATICEYRRRGYATEMVKTVLQLAKDSNFHRVSASDVVSPTEHFWRQRRFVQPPRLPYSDDLIRQTDVPIGHINAIIDTEPLVSERLLGFSSQGLSVSGRRPQ
jgi:hypothetical protein